MPADCACIAIIAMALPVREIAKLVSAYVPHRTDIDVIRDRLGHSREWKAVANDNYLKPTLQKCESRKQEVVIKISFSKGCISLDMEETCEQYHSHLTYGILNDVDDYRAPGIMNADMRAHRLEYSSPLFVKLIDATLAAMDKHILAILAKADRHYAP